MSRIKSKNTKPELKVRRFLHKQGLRYRLHANLPGKPDISFPGIKYAIFVHGCFWHQHGCKNSTMPKTNKKFWGKKMKENNMRDKRNIKNLTAMGWKTATVWECEAGHKRKMSNIANQITELYESNNTR